MGEPIEPIPLDYSCPADVAYPSGAVEQQVSYQAEYYPHNDGVRLIGAWDEDGLWVLDKIEPYDLARSEATARHWGHDIVERSTLD